MRHPQLLIYEHDSRLSQLLQSLAQNERWSVVRVREPAACLGHLQRGTPTTLVLKMGRDLEREVALLEQVTWEYPDTATVVVGDVDHSPLAGLAWDLGARCVLFPPMPRDHLPAIVAGLMTAAIEAWKTAHGQTVNRERSAGPLPSAESQGPRADA
jgi:DNA-binding NarL/FixJ family response regulator